MALSTISAVSTEWFGGVERDHFREVTKMVPYLLATCYKRCKLATKRPAERVPLLDYLLLIFRNELHFRKMKSETHFQKGIKKTPPASRSVNLK